MTLQDLINKRQSLTEKQQNILFQVLSANLHQSSKKLISDRLKDSFYSIFDQQSFSKEVELFDDGLTWHPMNARTSKLKAIRQRILTFKSSGC
jgi:hypothetical protein